MVERADELGTELTWQMGRPLAQSPFEIRRGFQERARYMIDIAADALADVGVDAAATGSSASSAASRSASCWCWRRGTIRTSPR